MTDTVCGDFVTCIALTHHRKILQVDTCTAYHAGNNLFVEVDVVMAPDTPLWESHDISEGLQVSTFRVPYPSKPCMVLSNTAANRLFSRFFLLQIKLESLPNVERAFVHVDYETSHAPEHRKMK